jgi:hypothetical protein
MDVRTQQQLDDDSRHRKLKSGVGLALIALGVIAIIFLAERIFTLANGPRDIPLIAQFVSFDAAARTITTPEGKYEMAVGVYFAAGLFLYIVALSLVAGLAKVLVSSGASLLSEYSATLVERIRADLGRAKRDIEHLAK